MPDWNRSSFCLCGNGSCVEVVMVEDQVLVRDSKHPELAPLVFTRGEWVAFLLGAKNDEFTLDALKNR